MKAQSHVALVVAVSPVANSLYMLGITTSLVFNTYSNLKPPTELSTVPLVFLFEKELMKAHVLFCVSPWYIHYV
jgi:hypothetical protein